jgi:hypothetical protein
MPHTWSEDDDTVALYLFRYGVSDLGVTEGEILRALDIAGDSMEAKKLNYKFLRTGEGLRNASEQSREIYQRYRYSSRQDLTARVLAILGSKGLHD